MTGKSISRWQNRATGAQAYANSPASSARNKPKPFCPRRHHLSAQKGTAFYEVKAPTLYEVKGTTLYEVKGTTLYEVKGTTLYEVKGTTFYEVKGQR